MISDIITIIITILVILIVIDLYTIKEFIYKSQNVPVQVDYGPPGYRGQRGNEGPPGLSLVQGPQGIQGPKGIKGLPANLNMPTQNDITIKGVLSNDPSLPCSQVCKNAGANNCVGAVLKWAVRHNKDTSNTKQLNIDSCAAGTADGYGYTYINERLPRKPVYYDKNTNTNNLLRCLCLFEKK
jgi:hypothetical protein